MQILFAPICPAGTDDSTLNFATSLLNFLNTLEGTNHVTINFVNDPNQALDQFARNASFDRLILCNTRIGAAPDFLKQALKSVHPFVSAVYPLPGLDWDKVTQDSKEDLRYRGLTYNVDVADATKRQGDYIIVKQTTLGLVVLKREVVDTILKQHSSEVQGDPQHLLYNGAVRDGKTLDRDANFCWMWGGDIAADVVHTDSLSAPMPFCGCIGQRSSIR